MLRREKRRRAHDDANWMLDSLSCTKIRPDKRTCSADQVRKPPPYPMATSRLRWNDAAAHTSL